MDTYRTLNKRSGHPKVPGGKSFLEQGFVRFFLSSQVALPDMSLCSFNLTILNGSQSPHSPMYLHAEFIQIIWINLRIFKESVYHGNCLVQMKYYTQGYA